MRSRVIFLGNAGDIHTAGKQVLASGGFVLQIEGYQFHIDPGPGSLVQLAQCTINPRETTALITTNDSILSSNDTNAVVSAMTLDGLDQKGVLIASDDVINGSDAEPPILMKRCHNFLERVIVAKPGQKIGIESVEIHTLKTKSSNPNSFGVKFITPNFVVSYSGNTLFDEEIAEQYLDSDLLILNVPFPLEESKEGLTAQNAINIINKVKPKRTILTGFGKKMLNANPIYVAREIQRQTNSEIICAKLGLVLNLD